MKFTISLIAILFTSALLNAQSSSYSFQHEVKVEMRQTDTDLPQDTYEYAFLFPEEGECVGLVGNMTQSGMTVKTKAVFDAKNQFIITLMDQGGMKMGMKMSTEQNLPAEAGEKLNNMKIRKTGNTKKIMGYDCVEYEVTDGESYSLIWISKDVELPNFYNALSAINQQGNDMGVEIPEGFMMHMTAWPEGKDSDQKVELVVTEINMNQSQEISTEGFQIMDVPNR